MDQSVNPSKKMQHIKCQNILNTFRRVHRDLKKNEDKLRGVFTAETTFCSLHAKFLQKNPGI